MSIEKLACKWIDNLRKSFSAKQFDYCHIEVIPHALVDFPCRPISQVLIDSLFLKRSDSYEIDSKDIAAEFNGTRTACYILDADSQLLWRFILEIIKDDDENPTFKIVSAYPIDTTGKIKYPSKKLCCFYIKNSPKCRSYKVKFGRMP